MAAALRARFCSGLGLLFLMLAAGDVAAAFGSSTFGRIGYAVPGGGFALTCAGWLWQAHFRSG